MTTSTKTIQADTQSFMAFKLLALIAIATITVFAFSLSSAQEATTEAMTEATGTEQTSIDYSIQPSIGSDDAPAKVILFEDFSCSHCATFTEQALPKLKAAFLENGQAEFFFVNNQFLGPNSIMAGMAGECAYEQDEALFWDYKTILFRAQNKIRYDAQTLAGLAASIPGLDQALLGTCISDRRHMDTINADLAMAKDLGVVSTPTVFVNGEMVVVEYNTESDPMDQFVEGISVDIRAAVEIAAMATGSTDENTEGTTDGESGQ